jgi:hypothetical protein
MSKTRKKPVAKKRKSTAVAVVDKSKQQLVSRDLNDPGQIMEFGKILNKYIADNKLSVNIKERDGKEKKYPLCGAWKFAGNSFGLTAVPKKLTAKHKEGQYTTILYAKLKFEGKRKDGTKYEYEKEVVVFVGFTEHEKVIEGVRNRYKDKITREIVRPYYAYECEVDVERISDGKIMNTGKSVCSNLEVQKSGFDEYAVMGQAQTRTISRALKNLLDFVLNAAGMEGTPGEEIPHDVEHEVVPESEKPLVKKQALDEDQFAKILGRAKAGDKVLEKTLEHFTMTQEQEDALRILENPQPVENK